MLDKIYDDIMDVQSCFIVTISLKAWRKKFK